MYRGLCYFIADILRDPGSFGEFLPCPGRRTHAAARSRCSQSRASAKPTLDPINPKPQDYLMQGREFYTGKCQKKNRVPFWGPYDEGHHIYINIHTYIYISYIHTYIYTHMGGHHGEDHFSR